MGLRFDPVGGGQFKAAVEALIEAERQPVKTMENRKKLAEERLKVFKEFQGKFTGLNEALDAVSTFNKLRELKVDLGDGEDLMSVTLDKTKARPGSYTVQVDQIAARSSMISNNFESPGDPALGVGFIILSTPEGDTFEIFVDESKSSLFGVSELINNNPDSPVRAAVIQDAYYPDAPYRLIVSAKGDGVNDAVDFPEFYFVGGNESFYIEEEHDAKNAYLLVDGFEIDTASNQVANFLPGVNIQLKAARPDRPFTINITEDVEKISGKIKDVVEKMNSILDFINVQNTVDEDTDTRTMFTGDSTLASIEFRFRNLLHEGYFTKFVEGDEDDPAFMWLHEIGVQFDKTGRVEFDENKFKQAVEENYEEVSEAVAGEAGFAYQLESVLSVYTRTYDGLLASRSRTLKERIDRIDDQIVNRERIIDKKVESLVGQFSRLQGSLSALQQQSQFVQASLGQVGGSSIAQLLGGGA